MVSRVKQVLLAIGITIIFNFFVFYGIDTFYEAPKYEKYCNSSRMYAPPITGAYDSNSTIDCRDCIESQGAFSCRQCTITAHAPTSTETKEHCEKNGGRWSGHEYTGEYPARDASTPLKESAGYCDYDYYCRTSFETDNKSYQRNVFIAGMIIGIATILISLFVMIESVSSGLMAGGIIVLIISLIRYWNELNKQLRFVILTIVLIILIWVGYKKLNPKIQEMQQARQRQGKKR